MGFGGLIVSGYIYEFGNDIYCVNVLGFFLMFEVCNDKYEIVVRLLWDCFKNVCEGLWVGGFWVEGLLVVWRCGLMWFVDCSSI